MWINRERYDYLLQRASVVDQTLMTLNGAKARIEDLKTEIELLKTRNDREQQRADSALQVMVAHKTGVAVPTPVVTPSTEDIDPHAEDPTVVDELRERVRKGDPLQVLLEEHATR